MKHLFSILAAALLTLSVSAATTIVLTSPVSGYDNQAFSTITQDGFTLNVAQGKGNNPPKWFANGLRLYFSNTITISGSNITRLDITFSKQGQKDYADLSAAAGSLVSGGSSTAEDDLKVDVWTGNASSVTLTVGASGQRLIKQVVIYGEGDDIPDTPVTPAQPAGNRITDLTMGDAYFYYDDWGYPTWDIDLYKDLTDDYEYVYPEVYLIVDASDSLHINGTYDLYYAGYWTSVNDSVEASATESAYAGTVTFAAVNEAGYYSVQGSFTVAGTTYTIDAVVDLMAWDYVSTGDPIILEDDVMPQGLFDVRNDNPAEKFVRGNQLIIRRAERSYNAAGQRLQ
ncbi:MAG: hypothetical protein IJ581_00705 [Paludibacteraceae bacterium]|nr:hypothetical protein [Paludibacteraceae bacterium]